MGVKYFYTWCKKNMTRSINTIPPRNTDVLAIDLNGIFHSCAQSIYKYGNVQPLLISCPKISNAKTNLLLFQEICGKIEKLVMLINPKQKLVLCVDGVAGMGKINQQRQRRFKSSLTSDESRFDPNSFTPGTQLMDHLTKYIDWFIRNMMTNHPLWQRLDVIFSNEKAAGEGEHKCMQFLRKHVNAEENVVIYGLDADLIMISLLLPQENVWIARESEYYAFTEYVCMRTFRQEIIKKMQTITNKGNDADILRDFVFINFILGNDFIPCVPSISISDGAIDILLQLYNESLPHGLFQNGVIGLECFFQFFKKLGDLEKDFIEKKYNSQQSFFPDPLIIKNLHTKEQRHLLYFDQYKSDYYKKKFPVDVSIPEIVQRYFDGLFWIMEYYENGIPDWNWFYPYFYAPFISDFLSVEMSYEKPIFHLHSPLDPFLQLVMVLPENSSHLLPDDLKNVFSDLSHFFPSIIEIDLTGKKKEWEGIVILPIVNLSEFKEYYEKKCIHLSINEKKRNIWGKHFIYKFQIMKRENFTSYYGNIANCPIISTVITF